MRMWMVDPSLLCRQHLLGEHKELHMLVGCIERGKNLRGYLEKNLVELSEINVRHDQLVKEMSARGYDHQSPLPVVCVSGGKVDVNKSLLDLKERCKNCRV